MLFLLLGNRFTDVAICYTFNALTTMVGNMVEKNNYIKIFIIKKEM